MSTINRLSSVDALQPGDLIPVWDGSNGDTRKASLTTLLAFIESNFADPDYSTRIVAPNVDGFNVDIGNTGDSSWLIVNPVLNYTTGSITLPSTAYAVNDQEITVVFTAQVSSFSITGAGATVLGAPTQIGTYDSFRVRYNAAQLTWYTLDTTGDGSGSGTSSIVRQDFTGDGVVTTFALANAPAALGNELQVFIDGVYQERAGYSVSGNNLVFSEAPPVLSTIEVLAWGINDIGATTANLVTYTPAGTGAVATTVQDKLRESVSVLDFGAVGDTVLSGSALPISISSGTDDTAAINAALAANAGGSVHFPAGVYKITSPLLLPTNTTITGDGNLTIIVTDLDIEMLTKAAASSWYCLIRDLQFMNVYPVTATVGASKFHIHATDTGGWRIDFCTFKSNFTDSDHNTLNHGGVSFDRTTGGSFNATIDNCFFDHCQINMAISDSGIKNTHLWANSMDYAIRLGAPNNTVIGCNISAGLEGAVVSDSSPADVTANNQSNHTIVGNNIDGGGQSYTGYGIRATAPVNWNITGNRINQCYKAGIWLDNAAYVAISGNTFFDNNLSFSGYSGVELAGSTFASSRVSVVGNSFAISAATATQGYAIREMSGGTAPANCSYVGNTLSGNMLAPGFLILAPLTKNISGNYGFDPAVTITPTVTPGAGAITAYTATATYTKVDNLVTVIADVTVTTVGTSSGFLTISGVPATTSAVRIAGTGRESVNTGSLIQAYKEASDGTINIAKIDGSALAWVNGDRYVISVTYPVA